MTTATETNGHGDALIFSCGKPFHCYRCNKRLGRRVTTGLDVGTVILHPKQSFTCTNCKTMFKSVSLAFAGTGAPMTQEALPVAPVVPQEAPQNIEPPVPPKVIGAQPTWQQKGNKRK